MPFFSVVIPAFNAERFIIDALDSVDGQTFTDYEIIVVDDGSQDATSRLVRMWAERNCQRGVRVYRQDNKGIGAARNMGVHHANGDFVAFLDSDDNWLERKLERIATYIGQHPEADLVCHDEWLIDSSGQRRVLRYGSHTQYEDLLFKGDCVSTSATAVRRCKVLAVGGFSEDLSFNGVEDYDLWLRLVREGCRLAHLHEMLGYYRVHGDGVTSKVEQHLQHSLNVLEAHFREFRKQNSYYRYLMRRRRAAAIRSAGRTLMKQGKYKQAQQLLVMALKEDPLTWKTWLLSALNIAHVSV